MEQGKFSSLADPRGWWVLEGTGPSPGRPAISCTPNQLLGRGPSATLFLSAMIPGNIWHVPVLRPPLHNCGFRLYSIPGELHFTHMLSFKAPSAVLTSCRCPATGQRVDWAMPSCLLWPRVCWLLNGFFGVVVMCYVFSFQLICKYCLLGAEKPNPPSAAVDGIPDKDNCVRARMRH